MQITYAVPCYIQLEGLRPMLDSPVDTETRLHLEQMIDRGDAIVSDIMEEEWEGWDVTITTVNGGTFLARTMEGSSDIPALSLPAKVQILVEMCDEVQRMTDRMAILIAANKKLEERVKLLTAEAGWTMEDTI